MHSNRDKEDMDGGGDGGDENEFPSAVRGRKYSPVVAHDNDRAVLEMSSIDPRSSSSPYSKQDLKYSLLSPYIFSSCPDQLTFTLLIITNPSICYILASPFY